ncbi:MAG: hypothetical protein HY721_15850 [Planctomycetes bacterium]|nr:hypothetical protein [Planctomycetota bacterium]
MPPSRLLQVLGLFDLATLAMHGPRGLAQATRYFAEAGSWPPVVLAAEALRAALVLSLAASAAVLLSGRRGGALLSWVQLGPRLALAALGESRFLSFAPIGLVAPLLPPDGRWAYGLLGLQLLLEVLRPPVATFIAWRRSRRRLEPRSA